MREEVVVPQKLYLGPRDRVHTRHLPNLRAELEYLPHAQPRLPKHILTLFLLVSEVRPAADTCPGTLGRTVMPSLIQGNLQ